MDVTQGKFYMIVLNLTYGEFLGFCIKKKKPLVQFRTPQKLLKRIPSIGLRRPSGPDRGGGVKSVLSFRRTQEEKTKKKKLQTCR